MALVSIVAGILILQFPLAPVQRDQSAESQIPPTALPQPGLTDNRDVGFLRELRSHASLEAAPEAIAAFPETVPALPDNSEPGAPEAHVVLETAPLPPPRPANIATSGEIPLPPPRPKDLATGPGEPPAQAAPAAAAPQTASLAPEAVLRPAPEDAFTKEAEPRFQMGSPVYVRIFKQEGQLELWLRSNGRLALYRTYPICKWSGRLGPKIKEADYQSPEGFYSVSAKQLNPRSNYHRAFNVGYPNAFDRQNGRTGGLVMVHGACKSVGCFAMTDRGIEEIYGFVAAAINAGQREVPVHIFPFRMTESAIARETGGGWLAFVGGGGSPQWASFWRNLKEGYDIFEQTGEPPAAFACGDHYAFGAQGASCQRIAGW
jgi:murein L,D-transpeptidase YafK